MCPTCLANAIGGKIKAAGFNLIRVHVHVDLPEFYELCTELGIGIMQYSEYN